MIRRATEADIPAIAGIYDRLHHIAQTGRVGEVYTHMGVREEV